ncbi:antiviral helicase [Laetiporus sulphureus 93-53]|uniref:Antiviral helicase n=1 Tax=Laetiporus sulphureus 93-53 TaxID=1314785 RepID=A0A165F8M1_9APHY|nr:antiviral helicase [Laetiporus sulphureus 93-53]KZT08600.1 antiviral helicase [Laetiporus sulphureus 93-53]
MGSEQHEKVLERLLRPRPEDSAEILLELGLSGLPTREQVHREIEEKLLLPKERLPEHWLPTYQIHWDHEISVPSLLSLEPSPPPTTLAFVRAGLHGRVTGYKEVSNPRIPSGLTSTSLDRAPGPSGSFVRGKAGYVPFWPGGLEQSKKSELDVINDLQEESIGLRRVAPGLSRGLRLPGEEVEETLPEEELEPLSRPIKTDIEFLPNGEAYANEVTLSGTSEIDELLPTTRTQLTTIKKPRRPAHRTNVQKRDWAHVVNVNKEMTNFHELVPDMAHKYPFELDTFQKQAVYHLEMGDSVFVAAHTSAGKTVVAEYAIALAGKHMTRAIYTSPIKALSNQKYRDFKQTFSSSSIGILTGDVQINPEANCLIMTTEILRSMLYKGADLIRDVEFVIFDEVHYVNDAERGVVWEEVIIMLPDHVNIILLSATVPNAKEFADWVGRTKKKDIYVISTSKRPVPLEHYLYAGRDFHKIVDANGNFLGEGYRAASEALRRKQDKEREAAGLAPVQRLGARAAAPQRGQRGGPAGRGGQRGGTPSRGAAPPPRGGSPRTFHQPDKNLYVHLMGNLKKKSLLPVVVFTLSKKRCEENASTLTNLDLCTAVEKSEIHVAIEKALSRLKGSDRRLPQIRRMRDLLSRGIGVHHGGLLPIVKEVVEILFARGLVKVLFATETFAMGVNMPAKCVVFSNIRKHDGRAFRDILPGEYTQMAGRAGRRGLDPTGTVVIVANDTLPEQSTLNGMILGKPSNLQSQFRLTYNMILNLLRVEALRVEEMIKRSFSENSSQKMLPDQMKKVIESEKVLSRLPELSCDVCFPDIEHFYDASYEIVDLNQTILSLAAKNSQWSRLMGTGRVVVLRDERFRWNMAVVLRNDRKTDETIILAMVDPETKAALLELERKEDASGQSPPPRWPPTPTSLVVDDATYYLWKVPLTSIAMMTASTIKVDADVILSQKRISSMNSAIQLLNAELEKWLQVDSIPEADWSKFRSLEFQEALRERDELVKELGGFQCTICSDFDDHYMQVHSRKSLIAHIEELKRAVSEQNMELIPDYEQRIGVLKDLKFIDENSTVLLKGRVACEINSANELVLTELILENTLANFEPEEVVALLSCFVFQEKTDVEPIISPKLEEGRDAIIAIAERVSQIKDYHKVPGDDFRALKFGLMEVVYEWAKGMPFEQITDLTDVPEGTIVRVITRLDETCREVRDAARVIGDAELFKKMEESQIKIKRDIVFAASLYF